MTRNDLAIVFPGQGSQALGMLAALAAQHGEVRAAFDEASEGCGADLWTLSQDGPEEQLNRTEFTQPALLAAGVAAWRVWQARGGAVPARLAGHSLGEYTALVAAGALSLADGARLVRARGQFMQQAVPEGSGAMAAVLGADESLVEQVCREVAQGDVLAPANYNSPGQIVIAGGSAAVDRALDALAAAGVRKAVRLAVSVPSHTAMMLSAGERLAESMDAIAWQEPSIPVVQNVDAAVHMGVPSIRDALVAQLSRPVRWTDCMQALVAGGARHVFECGPGKVLTGLARRIDRGIDARSLGAPDELDAALQALAA